MKPTFEQRLEALEKIIQVRFPAALYYQKVAIVETVQNIVADEFYPERKGVELLLGDRRHEPLVWHRHLAMERAHEWSGLSSAVLGPLFHRRDHTSILYAMNQVRNRTLTSKSAQRDFELVENRLRKALASHD